jgi:hypothetical protein
MQGWLKCEKRLQTFGCNISNKENSLVRRARRSVDDTETYILQVGYEAGRTE